MQYKQGGVTYKDRNELPIYHGALVINVNSINRLAGSIQEFYQFLNREMVTNGKLVLLFEMAWPPVELENIFLEKLAPLGFEVERDLIALQEQYTRWEEEYIHENPETIPGAEGISWLDTVVNKEGSFVWFKE